MINININKQSIANLQKLSQGLEMIPVKIGRATDRAGAASVPKIKEDILSRGKPGKYISVSYARRGQYGLSLKILPIASHGGAYGGSKANRRRNTRYAAQIFLSSESGKLGRKSFVLDRSSRGRGYNSTDKKGSHRGYVVSHSSGRWKVGKRFWRAYVPAIGPFYFSANSGRGRKKISTSARQIMIKELNKNYKNILSRNKI